MSRAHRIVHLVASSLACLIGVCFVLGYNGVYYHNNVEHRQIMDLPAITNFFAVFTPWALLLPPSIFAVGLAARKHEWTFLIVTYFGWLFAIAWPLSCIFAWECPFVLL